MTAFGLLLSVAIGVSLGFFGGGGSILTVPLLVYVFGLAPREAIATSLLVVAAASAVAALQHARAGNLRLRVALLFGAAGMAGAYLGALVAAQIAEGVLLLLFAAIMALTALAMWRGRSAAPSASAERASAPGRLVVQGFVVGSFTGLVGAGGGFLIVPALALWAGLPIAEAIGTSLLVIVLNSLAGFAGHVSQVAVDYRLAAAVAGCAIAGSFAGSRLTQFVAPSSLRRAFAGFVLVMAAVILVREANLVMQTGASAVPQTLPQLLFALAMLGIGIFAGRASRASRPIDAAGLEHEGGTGI